MLTGVIAASCWITGHSSPIGLWKSSRRSWSWSAPVYTAALLAPDRTGAGWRPSDDQIQLVTAVVLDDDRAAKYCRESAQLLTFKRSIS